MPLPIVGEVSAQALIEEIHTALLGKGKPLVVFDFLTMLLKLFFELILNQINGRIQILARGRSLVVNPS